MYIQRNDIDINLQLQKKKQKKRQRRRRCIVAAIWSFLSSNNSPTFGCSILFLEVCVPKHTQKKIIIIIILNFSFAFSSVSFIFFFLFFFFSLPSSSVLTTKISLTNIFKFNLKSLSLVRKQGSLFFFLSFFFSILLADD